MRIALVPLDNRPPNFQFPKRLAAIAGIELLMPDRDMLGTLHKPAKGLQLAKWLLRNSTTCDAIVFSWDALVYGGLVQSRRTDLHISAIDDVINELKRINWNKTAGFSYLTVPRLGITVDRGSVYAAHQAVREYFIKQELAIDDPEAADRANQLANTLGEVTIAALWEWRNRNQANAMAAIRASCELGLNHCHVAVEDNAPVGPHLIEVAELNSEYKKLKSKHTKTAVTFFDGADECASMLLAKAICTERNDTMLHVPLTVHPAAPGADRYTGVFESHPLGDGLMMVSKLLGLDYDYDGREFKWYVAHGVQPQPDVFASDPRKVFENPFLLPKILDTESPLFITDLAACNGANPLLANKLAKMSEGGIIGLVGFNTNFNSLGLSAAWIRLLNQAGSNKDASRQFLLERLADDIVYQSIARPEVTKYVKSQKLDPMNFEDANYYQNQECKHIVMRAWQDWIKGTGEPVLKACRISTAEAGRIDFEFPWQRTFETEVVLKDISVQ